MKNSFFTTGIFTAFLFLGMNAQAQEAQEVKVPKTPAQKIERLDSDKDGRLSLEEVSKAKKGKMAEKFNTIDTNGDGFIDITELEARAEKRKNRKLIVYGTTPSVEISQHGPFFQIMDPFYGRPPFPHWAVLSKK